MTRLSFLLRLLTWIGLILAPAACVEDPSPGTESETDSAVLADAAADATLDATVDATPAVPDATVLPPDLGTLPCIGDADCGPGGTCQDGQCVDPECQMDGDCPAPMLQACRDFVCRDRCLGQTCIRGGICIDGACEPEQCVVDGDCNGDQLCRQGRCIDAQPCETNMECGDTGRCTDGNCEPLAVCAGDRNCAADEICQGGLCRPQPTCMVRGDCSAGEDCVGARCVPFVCRGAGDCPMGEECRGGACVEITALDVARVVILTRPRALSVGEGLQLRAVGLDERGDVVAVSGFEWSAQGAGAVDAQGHLVAGMAAGEVAVVAAYQTPDARIQSDALVIAVVDVAPPEGRRVRVTDSTTGAPIEGATVRAGAEELPTDADGSVTIAAQGAVTITVFSATHDYVTVVDTALDDVWIALTPRSSNARVAGFTGRPDFDRVDQAGEVDLGLAGATLAGGITRIDLGSLLGQIFQVPVNAGPLNFDLPLPGGLTLAAQVPILGQLRIKDDYFVTANPGFQFAWSFAGRINFGTLGALFQGGGGGGGFNVGRVLATLLPFFDEFRHGLRVAELAGLPRLADADDVDGDGDLEELVPDYDRFPVLNMEPAQPQQLRVNVQVSDPNAVQGEGAAVALVLAGSDVDGVGFVPLGISSADGPADLAMRQAAPYAGLEAGQPTLVALAARFGGGNFLPDSLSGRVARFPGALPAQLALGDFLPLPEGATWNAALRALDADGVAGATVHRATFAGPAGRWTVWFTGAPTVTLPFPPDGAADLAAAAEIRVEALHLGVRFADLIGPGPGDLTDIDGATDAFSRTTAAAE